MSDEGIRIRARIWLLPSQESGRTSPIVGISSYRPSHNFLDSSNRKMGRGSIDLPHDAVVHPGQSVDLDMTLYPWPPDTDLSPGREWRIQEGGHLVAIGTVLAVLSSR